jgi:outer membrane protein assembly factor BamA
LFGVKEVKVNAPKFVSDSTQLLKECHKILQELYLASYLSATIDSIRSTEGDFKVFIDQGEQFKWLNLSPGNLDPLAQSKVDLSGRLFLNRPFNSQQLEKLFRRTIKYYENNGYPFARVALDSIMLSENKLSAALNVKKNQYYIVDSILLKGQSGIKKSYLLHYLDLKAQQAYNEEAISSISKRILEIPFIEEERPHQVQFFEEGVKILLYTKKKRASRFDGVLGLLSNEGSGKIELTGDVDLNLINSFNRGEHLQFNWRKLKGNSQDLTLGFLYPYFLNTPFGIDFDFKLYKRDTTFIDLISRLGVSYALKRGEVISFYVENKTSNLLSRRSLITNSSTLPEIGDVSINSFGLAYELKRYDYIYNPTKGFMLRSQFFVGRKKLRKILALEEENPGIYDDVDLSTTQYQAELKLRYFVPLGKRSTIMLGNQSASNYSERLYQNELLRIGGLKVLRGFDEESINASTYSVFTLEYRFLLDRNSYFSLFSDGGIYENNNIDGYSSDTPLGLGAGISFETNAGIFTFNYAIGKQMGNPFQFQAAKIHFGFVNFF